MSVYDDLITGLKARVDSVSNVGQTHGYQRYSHQMPEYLDMFKATISGQDQIRGWMISLDARDPIGPGERVLPTLVNRPFNLEIFGLMGVSDADQTEATFINLALSIMDAVEGRLDLGASHVFTIEPCSMRLYQIRMFGNHLCHVCEIAVPAKVDVTITPAAG